MMMIVQAKQYYNLPVNAVKKKKGLSTIIPTRDANKKLQNGDSEKSESKTDSNYNSLTDDVFVSSDSGVQKSSRDSYIRDSRDTRDSRQSHRKTYAYDDLREPHKKSNDPNRAYDPHRKNRDKHRDQHRDRHHDQNRDHHRDQQMYDGRRSARDDGRRSARDVSPHRDQQMYDDRRSARDVSPHRDQQMYDGRRSARDASPQGRRSRQDGYNGSYERNGRYGDSYGYPRDYDPGKPPSSPRRSRSFQSPSRSYSPNRSYSRNKSPTRNETLPRTGFPSHRSSSPPRTNSLPRPGRPRSPSPDRIHNHAFVSEGNREVTINSEAKREEVEFRFDESGQRVTTGHTVIAVTAYRANDEADGPPKPPRRQQSLNRIHIPEGPDYDPTSASDSPHSGTNSPKTAPREPAFKVSQQDPNYANYPSSRYAQSDASYVERTQTHSVTTTQPEYRRQRSLPDSYHDNPPTYRDVEEYRSRSVMGDYISDKSRQGPRARRNVDKSNRAYRSDGENDAISEPELDWDHHPGHPLQHSHSLRSAPGGYGPDDRSYKPSHLKHSDSLRSAPGGYGPDDRPSHLKHSDSLRSAPGGYSYGSSEPSWKRDPRLRYQQEISAYHGSLARQSRRDHVPRSQQSQYLTQQYPTSSDPMKSGRRSAPPISKQGYSSDSGISSYKNPSESDPVYENTDRKQVDPNYANTNGYADHLKNGGIWARDDGGYVVDGPHEMAVDVPQEMVQQKSSAPLMASLPTEGSKHGLPAVPRDDKQAQTQTSSQDPKWSEHLARREQRRQQLRSSSQESIESDQSDYDNQPEQRRRRTQRRHTTEIPLTQEGIIKPELADTQESGYPNDMPKRQRQNGRVPSKGGNHVPNSMYQVPYNNPNMPYAPNRPHDPYNPYQYGPYGELPPRMNFAPIHPGYAPYGPSPMDPRYGAHSPTPGMHYGVGHPYEHKPGNQSPTGRPPQRWPPGPDPRYSPHGFAHDPYMPYGQSQETYSAAYNMPPYLQQGGYYQPPIPSAMFYGSQFPSELPQRGLSPTMGSPKRARSVDALQLQANAHLEASPRHSPTQSVSPQRSLSPDDKARRMQELRQRVKSYLVEDKKKRSKSVGDQVVEEAIAPTQSNVAHAAPPSGAPPCGDSNGMPSESSQHASHETATSVGTKLFLKKKKEAYIQDIKQTIIRDKRYGSEPDLNRERDGTSSSRPLRLANSSGNDSNDNRQRSGKAEKITEVALNELESMYALLDKETSELLESGEYQPEYERLKELKLRTKKRLEDLKKEHEMEEPSQRDKRRTRRAKSELSDENSYRSQYMLTQSEDERQQQFFPYRTSQHPDNLNLDDQSYKPVKDPQKMQFIKRNVEMTSEDDDDNGSDVRRSNSSLYRKPKSEDYMGYSSDSSPSPERRMKNSKRKPVAQPRRGMDEADGEPVLPEYIKKSTARSDYSAPKSGYDSDKSGRSLADRRREFFLSGVTPSTVSINLERPLSPTRRELAVAYSEIKLMTSAAMTTYARTRSKSPGPRDPSPVPYPEASRKQPAKKKSPAVKEPTIISVSNRTIEASAPKKPVPAPRRTLSVPSVENQPAGARTSVSSVSTIDSTGLSQPFEEMGREYGSLIGEHYPHMADRDLSRHSSSMESLVKTVSREHKSVPGKSRSPRAPPPPDNPPPESDVDKSGDDRSKRGGGIWALLGPKHGASNTESDNIHCPLPSPDPTLTSDSDSDEFEMPHNANSTDESFQTPEELIPEIEEPVQATAVKTTELPPDLFKLPIENMNNIHYMDSDSDTESSEESDGTQPAQRSFHGHNDDVIQYADSSDESEPEPVKRIRQPLNTRREWHQGPNVPLAYDENGYL